MAGWKVPDDARELDRDRREYLRELASQRRSLLPPAVGAALRLKHLDGSSKHAAAIMAALLAGSILFRGLAG